VADYSAEQRRNAKAKGHALPNPSGGPPRFPIENGTDLANAIRLAGHAKGDQGVIRAYIRKRAKALGLSSRIPTDWN